MNEKHEKILYCIFLIFWWITGILAISLKHTELEFIWLLIMWSIQIFWRFESPHLNKMIRNIPLLKKLILSLIIIIITFLIFKFIGNIRNKQLASCTDKCIEENHYNRDTCEAICHFTLNK
jgi:hypothetical protein